MPKEHELTSDTLFTILPLTIYISGFHSLNLSDISIFIYSVTLQFNFSSSMSWISFSDDQIMYISHSLEMLFSLGSNEYNILFGNW